MLDVDKTRARLIKIIYIAIIAAGVYFSLKYLIKLAVPLILAVIIAETTRRPTDFLAEKLKLKRRICSAVIVTVVIAVLAAILWCAVWQLYSAAQSAIEKLPQISERIKEISDNVENLLMGLSGDIPEAISEAINNAPAEIVQSALSALTSLLTSLAGSLPDIFLTGGVSIIASYLVSADYYKLKDFLRNTLKPHIHNKLSATRGIVLQKFGKLIKGYFILMIITFVELFAGLTLMRVNNALIKAILIALIDILPVFGTGTVLVPWAVIALLQHNFYLGIGLAVIYIIISVIRNFIEPKIIGSQIKLSPLIVLMCMFIGYKVFGLPGLLFSPFAASIIRELAIKDVI